ncbi:YceI family protein [Acuticoccus mangrovi]|uniref:YceI family protein n=1 Tax=Acuticoccus mangrovi TaxID=2796142 RepID=A0A934IMJ0_9HYPH|nr:YceI family protein [Acuticoccus mangrovi]MBJ3775118.1 YceI family protein [Acuticoccus mangrovi]
MKTLAFLVLLLPALLEPRPAAAELASGTYRLVPQRAAAHILVTSPIGRARLELPFVEGDMVLDGDGRIIGGGAVLNAREMSANNVLVKKALSGANGFHVDQHATVGFRVLGGEVRGDQITIDGELTVKGVTLPVRFTGELLRAEPQRMVARLQTTIDRTGFGVTAGRPLYSREATVRLRLVGMKRRER